MGRQRLLRYQSTHKRPISTITAAMTTIAIAPPRSLEPVSELDEMKSEYGPRFGSRAITLPVGLLEGMVVVMSVWDACVERM